MYSVYLAESPSKRQKRTHPDTSQAPDPTSTQPQNTTSPSSSSSTSAHVEQLITEHLGFHSRVYIDQLTQLANEFVHNELAGPLEEHVRELIHRDATRPNADLEAEQGVHALITLIENALDHTFDTYELYCLRSVFRVSPAQARAITLAHHRGLDLRSVEEKRAYAEQQQQQLQKSKGSRAKGARASEAQLAPVNVLSQEEESRALAESAVQLRKKIHAARATNAALRAARAKSKQDLLSLQSLRDEMPILFGEAGDEHEQQDSSTLPTTTLSAQHPQIAASLQSSAQRLLEAVRALKAVDPLNISMSPGTNQIQTGEDPADPSAAVAAAGEGLAWSSREGYLKFVADKART
ncbi:hypothetical protein OC846_003097 [Tilletia horrida]|uniref:Uncharacterized protein n=1 Tax=Tilletia horrida TaxID=155126 RepID=A0AAN6GSI9_9BASI|nr:hypothetical protein OC845_002007 [Tilletia horrida]KAK0551916.1 hypothetical protein OC846_003097 [Tilletia horrida]KAK0568664.1 hypothetical protein OC861_001741 [Tilletia horrida]